VASMLVRGNVRKIMNYATAPEKKREIGPVIYPILNFHSKNTNSRSVIVE
jgi:hypothetical protein